MKTNYLPASEKEQLVWLTNFNAKFASEATALGFTAADITALNNDTAMFAFVVNQSEAYNTFKQKVTQYKDLIKYGPVRTVGVAPPVVPAAAAVPATVAPGILPRVSALVQRIKVSPAYTDAIGKNLGIIGQKATVDYTTLKPVLTLQFTGGQVEVRWVKGNADAICIEVDRGTGSWSFLAIDTVPHYTDTTPVTASATWRYRAMYLVSDNKVGQWSDTTAIAVG